MPTPEEIRSKARNEKATELVRWATGTPGAEGENATIRDILIARLIVAVEALEAKLDDQHGRG